MKTVIIGFMLLNLGGVPVVTSTITNVLGDMESLFAGAMTAINSVVSEVTKTRIKYVKTEKYHLYFGYSDKLTVVLISDAEDPQLHQLADRVIEEVLKVVDDPSRLSYDIEAQKIADRIIKEILAGHLPAISSITKIAEMVIASTATSEKGVRLGLGDLLFPLSELKLEKVDMGQLDDKISIKEVEDLLLRGDFERVVKLAPKLFALDKARILYVKAALKLNSLPPEIKAPPLNQVYSITMSIEDSLARSLLSAELKRFLEPGTYYEKEKMVEDCIFELGERVKRSEDGVIYLALALPTRRQELLELANQIVKDYHYLNYAMKSSPPALKASIINLSSFREWSSILGKIKYALSKLPSDLPEATYSYILAFQFGLLSSLMEKDVNPEVGRKMLEQAIEEAEKHYELLKKYSKSTPCDLVAANYWFTYNAITGLLLAFLPNERVASLAPKYGEKVADKMNWLINAAKHHRISIDMYLLSMMGMLASYSRIMFLMGIPIIDMPYYVEQLAVPEFERIGINSPHHYLHFIIDCLESLGHSAFFIPIESARRNILGEIASTLEKAYKSSVSIPIASTMAALNAVKFYVLARTDEAKKKAIEIAKEIQVNEFFKEISTRLLSIDEKLREGHLPYDIFT